MIGVFEIKGQKFSNIETYSNIGILATKRIIPASSRIWFSSGSRVYNVYLRYFLGTYSLVLHSYALGQKNETYLSPPWNQQQSL